jgi:transposase
MISKESLRNLSKEDLVEKCYNLTIMVDKMTLQVQSLQKEATELKNLKPKNSSNSSLPPSSDLFRLKNQSLRKKSGKKTGGQLGHKGKTLLMSKTPDETIHHLPDTTCPFCGKIHNPQSAEVVSKRQVIDIPVVKAKVIEHLVYSVKCTCGQTSTGNFPVDVVAPVQYGKNLTAFTAYLSTRQYVPFARLSELVENITGISMSQGTIYNLLNKSANAVLPIYNAIKENILKAQAVGGDETGLKVQKQKYWAWVWQTRRETYIVASKTRGFATIQETFPNGLPNAIYISDSLSAQLKTVTKSNQLCLAHILRELNYFIDQYQNKWAIEMKHLLQKAIRLKHRMTLNQYTEYLKARSEILQDFKSLIGQLLPDEIPKLRTLQKRLIKHECHMFNFLFYPDIPSDNNGSERAIRNVKVKQKVSGHFRSKRGAEMYAILQSVFDTFIKSGAKNPYQQMSFAINLAARKKAFQYNQLK